MGPGILYNTLQGFGAAAALLLLPVFVRDLRARQAALSLAGWGWTFAALGLVLFTTGLHMSLTWPLQNVPDELVQHCCAADNIVFGEPSVLFGALLLVAGIGLVRLDRGTPVEADEVRRFARPLAFAAALAGLTLVPIAMAGIVYGMWTAPEAEPVAGAFKDTILETAYVATCYLLTAVAAVLAPFVPSRPRAARVAAAASVLAGLGWLAITLSSYFGHVALSS